jgi:hypothetical protein
MTREELEFEATQKIGRWNDRSLPPMAGRPSFQVITKEPLEKTAVPCQLLKYNRHGYIYLFDAQDVLDYFDAIDRLEKAWVLSYAG